ncbi:PREDICTED: uncharacterized protein LOC106792810 [Polistes canadensis]|uniref:uncharacterized protein LOC106792810 n=1 Tax=Polistes canadensis TaxID=91411 RepID=UPI0007190522|nr:PREDICTED: uncharacterized protein LOC106792810 [Polistes canadensis]
MPSSVMRVGVKYATESITPCYIPGRSSRRVLLPSPTNAVSQAAVANIGRGLKAAPHREALLLTAKIKAANKSRIVGIGQTTTQPLHQVDIAVKSNCNNYRRKIDCVIFKAITQKLPALSMNKSVFAIPGIKVYLEILCTLQIKVTRSHPTLQKTQLEWVVGGFLQDVKGSSKRVVCNIATQVQSVDKLISRFWELDNITDVHPLTEQEKYCEEHFKRTHRRDTDTLRDAYTIFMKEYKDLGHLQTVPNDQLTPLNNYYVPHHAVLSEKSVTTKLRMVFDASAKSNSGILLNDALIIGPNIQDDLFSIIIRFRTYAYVITGDIEKIYRQIRVDESQVCLQKIFWRDDMRKPGSTYELLTLTYGTASASFLATRCLKEIVNLEEKKHPIGAEVVRHDFYVDALLTEADSIAKIVEIRE